MEPTNTNIHATVIVTFVQLGEARFGDSALGASDALRFDDLRRYLELLKRRLAKEIGG